MMRDCGISTLLLACAAGIGLSPAAQAQQKCPVLIQHISLAYNHAGGISTPQLQVKFADIADRDLAKVTFQLSVLDASGYPHVYPEDLEFRGLVPPKKSKLYSWDLDASSVDIHRTGETVLLKSVAFANGSRWTDDGSETCSLTFDFRAR